MTRISFMAVALVGGLVWASAADKKEKKEEKTQVLELPRELPAAVVGETARLRFHVTPLSARGLLSQQIRDALRALERDTGNDPVLHLRAFVAGSGDLRRVRDLVSEIFTARHKPLPALSLVRSGGLPLEGAQVVFEAISAGRKENAPAGLAFVSASAAMSESPLDPVAPLAEKSLADLRAALSAAGSDAAGVLRVTCFLSSLENLPATRKLVEAEYRTAALDYVQTQRAPTRAVAACEAVARAGGRAAAPEGPGRPRVALVASPRLVLAGTQVAFGVQESDGRLAFNRLQKALEQAGASPKDVALLRFYPLSAGIAAQVRKLRAEFYNAVPAPVETMLSFEGLPSMDASFALDAVAVKD